MQTGRPGQAARTGRPPQSARSSHTAHLFRCRRGEAAYGLAVAPPADPTLNVLAARRRLGSIRQAADHIWSALFRHGITLAARPRPTSESIWHGAAPASVQPRAVRLQSSSPGYQHATALLAPPGVLPVILPLPACTLRPAVKTFASIRPSAWSAWTLSPRSGRALDTIHVPAYPPVGQSCGMGSQTMRTWPSIPTEPFAPLFRAIAGAADPPASRRHGRARTELRNCQRRSVRLKQRRISHQPCSIPEGGCPRLSTSARPDLQGSEGFLKFGDPRPAEQRPICPKSIW